MLRIRSKSAKNLSKYFIYELRINLSVRISKDKYKPYNKAK